MVVLQFNIVDEQLLYDSNIYALILFQTGMYILLCHL